jgi:hypothetical protein
VIELKKTRNLRREHTRCAEKIFFDSGELEENTTVRNFRITQKEGKT